MKKIVVMSDNHGNYDDIYNVRELEPDADFYVHCGDSEADEEILEDWIAVCGNNDWTLPLNDIEYFEADVFGFVVCHGHRFGYFERERHMLDMLDTYQAQVLLSGHTHVPNYQEFDGRYLINPGSTLLPRNGSEESYCVITIENNKLNCEFKKMK